MSGSRIDRKWLLRGGIALLVVAFLVFRDALPEFDLEEIIEDLSAGLGSWTYLLVALLAFLETGAFVGLIAPGEFTVLLGGAVAGQGDISLPLILAITWLCGVLRRQRSASCSGLGSAAGSWSATASGCGSRRSGWRRWRATSRATAARRS